MDEDLDERRINFLLDVDQDDEWKLSAVCRGLPEFFFQERGGSYAEGKEMCARCSVIEQCAEEQRRTKSSGLWAGVVFRESPATRAPIEAVGGMAVKVRSGKRKPSKRQVEPLTFD